MFKIYLSGNTGLSSTDRSTFSRYCLIDTIYKCSDDPYTHKYLIYFPFLFYLFEFCYDFLIHAYNVLCSYELYPTGMWWDCEVFLFVFSLSLMMISIFIHSFIGYLVTFFYIFCSLVDFTQDYHLIIILRVIYILWAWLFYAECILQIFLS